MKEKTISVCCAVLAKPDRTRSVGYFCTACGKPCDIAVVMTGFGANRKPMKTKRKATGERKLFELLYHTRGKVSELSGYPLLPPEHPRFHHQGSHLLPKGNYPKARLRASNIVMVLPEEHDQWEREKDKDKLMKIEPRWTRHVFAYVALKHEYNTNNGEEIN